MKKNQFISSVWGKPCTVFGYCKACNEKKTCFEGADVAGMQRTLEASTDRSLYFLSLNFHQVKGQLKVPSSFLSQIDGSCLHKVNSASAAVATQTSGSLATALLAVLFAFSSK